MATRTFWALFVLLLALLGTSSTPAEAGSSHPYFDDGGTLVWYHRLADAQQAARAQGKLIFVEYGRRRCGSCKVLCNRVLPDRRVRGRLSALAVGLAAECDRPEAAVERLFDRHLRNAHMLPFAAFLTADGEWITGFAGSGRVESFLGHLAKAERARPRSVATPRAAPRPQPPVPPSVELTEADRAGRTSLSRANARAVPPAALRGSPDARVLEFPPCRTDLAKEPCRTGRCAGTRPQALPPPSVADVRSPRGATPASRQPVSRPASTRPVAPAPNANSKWADEKLDFAADAVAAGRFEEGLAAIESVLDRMPGDAAFVDAARGLDAIKRLLQQRFLDPEGQVAKAARRMAYEDMWGTRWAKLFK